MVFGAKLGSNFNCHCGEGFRFFPVAFRLDACKTSSKGFPRHGLVMPTKRLSAERLCAQRISNLILAMQ